jgi:acylphosphatase
VHFVDGFPGIDISESAPYDQRLREDSADRSALVESFLGDVRVNAGWNSDVNLAVECSGHGSLFKSNIPLYRGIFVCAVVRNAPGCYFDKAQEEMTDEIQARRFIVRGRVQGVGFRWFVEREAHILGIAGWVRNNPDGSVEVLAHGTRDQLSGLRSRLQQGPRAARVDAVEDSPAKVIAGVTSFRIEGAW